jgi:alanine-glyoxylate transaminase / serine-glyoxylate transaminase / serine-pyruvate transaminase
MAGRNFLMVPGPTNVPDRIQRAMLVAMEDHRSSVFPELTTACLSGLKRLFKTSAGSPIIFPSSGTGCWEAALSADKHHNIKAVLVCQNETSTGVSSDVGAVREAMDSVKHPALLFVDSVSALGSIDFRMDEWAVDVCVAGSQKGLMLPAGLGVTCVSQKALEAAKSATSRRCYFDYADMVQANSTGYFPYTPPLPLLYGLREALAMLAEEGLENVFSRHRYLAGGVRAAVLEGWKLKLCATAPKWYSNAVSAVMVPEGISGADVIARAFKRYNLSLGSGLSTMAGKLFRIGHLGDLNELMLLGALAGSELAMLDVGMNIEPGSGVAAAQNYWRRNSAVAQAKLSGGATAGLAA